jgi:5,10-methylenetetrahydrofolate reductase
VEPDEVERTGPTAAPAGDERRPDCPKRMVFGPCGGVRSGARCEVDDRSCPFVASPAPRWPAGRPDAPPWRGPTAGRALAPPIIVCDIRPAEATLEAARSLARAHAGWCDAVLLGEHHDRIDLPNEVLAPVLLEEGCRPWVTLTCRDRNGVALESELVALAELGVREVHCVTGDARAAHVRPGTTPVFDLDSLRLTALARSLGLTVSVAESPTVEPVEVRPRRAADKDRAGASWCFVNLGVTPGELDRFITRSRAEGSTLRHLVCVPVFTDATGADRLAALPGVDLDPSVVAAVVHAPDPRSAGIAHAVAAARTFLAIDGVDGVNLSGPASSAGPAERAGVMRAVAEQLRVPRGTDAGAVSTIERPAVPVGGDRTDRS